MNSENYLIWKNGQDLSHWHQKWSNKISFANYEGLENLLTLDEYMFKAFEAGLTSPNQISQNGYHLSRYNDKSNYTVESCRFLTAQENWAEQKRNISGFTYGSNVGINQAKGEKHYKAKLTNEQALLIYNDSRPNWNDIAIDFNVSFQTVYKIKKKETWQHLTKDF